MQASGKNIFIGCVIGVVVLAIFGGFFLSGSPAAERARNLDQQRVSDLQMITSAIDQFYNLPSGGGRLPASLDELRGRRDIYLSSVTDPKTGAFYHYNITGNETYELCADFELPTPNPADYSEVRPKPFSGTNFWDHGAGRTCYNVTVTKYPKPAI